MIVEVNEEEEDYQPMIFSNDKSLDNFADGALDTAAANEEDSGESKDESVYDETMHKSFQNYALK